MRSAPIRSHRTGAIRSTDSGGSLAAETTTNHRRNTARVLLAASCAVAVLGGAAGCQRGTGIGEKPRPLSPGTALGGPGDAPGHFIKPRAIDSDGRHLVVIDRSGRIQVIDPEAGQCVAVWRLPDTHLGFPTGLTLAPSPRGDGAQAVWVADTHYNRVLVYAMPPLPTDGSMSTVQPEVLLELGTYGTGAGEFTYPSDVLVLTEPDGRSIKRVYVSEFGGHDRVSVFEPAAGAFRFVSQIGHAGDPSEADGFQRPQALVLRKGSGDRADELLITDSINHRIGRFTLDGKPIAWLNSAGVPGREPGQFWHPRGMMMLQDGTAMVVEFGNNRVQHVNLDSGECLGLYGAPGVNDGELAEPWAIAAVGRRGFVVDARNHRLVEMKLPSAGEHFSAASGTLRPLAGGPGKPAPHHP